jgi:hypothetical protein
MRSVLVVIADAADRNGEHSNPGAQALVQRTLYSDGHVRRMIARLLAEGWIEQTERAGPGKFSEYRVRMEETPRAVASADPPPENPTTSRGRRADVARTSRASGADDVEVVPLIVITDTDTVTAPDGAGADPIGDTAQRLTVLAFEQPVKPTLRDGGRGAFPAARAIIERLLRNGVPVERVEVAIVEGVDVWTVAGLQTAVARSRPSRRRSNRPERSISDLVAMANGHRS